MTPRNLLTDEQCRDLTKAPIYTLILPGQMIYIITDSDLLREVDKSKALSWRLAMSKVIPRLYGVGKDTRRALSTDYDGVQGLQHDSNRAFHKGLEPGPQLDTVVADMIRAICDALEAVTPLPGNSIQLSLLEWSRNTIAAATTSSIFGPDNPLRLPAMLRAYE